MMHKNSIEAYSHGNESGELSKRATLVLGKIRQLGVCTDKEVMRALGFSDPNAVRPRITEMLKSGVLEEVGDVTDPDTNRPARRTRVRIAIPKVPEKPVEMRQATLFAEEPKVHDWGF